MTGEPIGRSVKSMHDPDVSFSGSGSPEDYYGVPIPVSLFSSRSVTWEYTEFLGFEITSA